METRDIGFEKLDGSITEVLKLYGRFNHYNYILLLSVDEHLKNTS